MAIACTKSVIGVPQPKRRQRQLVNTDVVRVSVHQDFPETRQL